MTESESRIFNCLTPRERAVILEILKGSTNKEIGSALSVMEQVVKNYLRVICQKTGVGSRFELAMFFVKRPNLIAALEGNETQLVESGEIKTSLQRAEIGRMVHYVPTKQERLDLNESVSPIPAVIVAVLLQGLVNLKVITNGPRDFWKKSVPPMTEKGQEGRWKWPQLANG